MKLTTIVNSEMAAAKEKHVTLKETTVRIKELAQNLFSSAYLMRKNLFGIDELQNAESNPEAKCMLDDMETIKSYLSECLSIIQDINERII